MSGLGVRPFIAAGLDGDVRVASLSVCALEGAWRGTGSCDPVASTDALTLLGPARIAGAPADRRFRRRRNSCSSSPVR